jgi:hypothetical protein
MNFDAYTDLSVVTAVDLVNTYDPISGAEQLTRPADLAAFLRTHRDSYDREVTEADVAQVRRLRTQLRKAFTTDDENTVVDLLNGLLRKSKALPQLSDHDREPWHLHFTPRGAPLADHMAAEAAMGLAIVLRDHGLDRLHT